MGKALTIAKRPKRRDRKTGQSPYHKYEKGKGKNGPNYAALFPAARELPSVQRRAAA